MGRTRFSTLGVALVLASCSGDDGGGTDDPIAGDRDRVVRFVTVGDTGEGNEAQLEVGQAMADKCAADGCDFAVLLGDNFYDFGVESVDDPLWQTHFEQPYADLDIPFFAVLGNHDYGGRILTREIGGMGNEFRKGPIEVEYTERSDKWVMLDTFFVFQFDHVGFIMLDTNSLLWDSVRNGDQREWLPFALSELSTAEWILSAGHHPVRSNGVHGDAGNYESIEVGTVEIPVGQLNPILAGTFLADFFTNDLCGEVDVYFAGHDHNRQWLDEPDALCGAELIVSGAGAKLKGFESTERNAVRFQDATTEGFMYVVIDGDTFTGELIDKNGVTNFSYSFTR